MFIPQGPNRYASWGRPRRGVGRSEQGGRGCPHGHGTRALLTASLFVHYLLHIFYYVKNKNNINKIKY